MNRYLAISLFLASTLRAQVPSAPTECSLNGLTPFATANCTSWQTGWPTQPGTCDGVSVLSVIGNAQLQSMLSTSSTPWPSPPPAFGFVTGHTDEATGREFALLGTNA